jgi:hypothetical protein
MQQGSQVSLHRKTVRQYLTPHYVYIKIRSTYEYRQKTLFLDATLRALSNGVLVTFVAAPGQPVAPHPLWPIGVSASPPFVLLTLTDVSCLLSLRVCESVSLQCSTDCRPCFPLLSGSLQARANHSPASRRQCTLCPSLLPSTTRVSALRERASHLPALQDLQSVVPSAHPACIFFYPNLCRSFPFPLPLLSLSTLSLTLSLFTATLHHHPCHLPPSHHIRTTTPTPVTRSRFLCWCSLFAHTFFLRESSSRPLLPLTALANRRRLAAVVPVAILEHS